MGIKPKGHYYYTGAYLRTHTMELNLDKPGSEEAEPDSAVLLKQN